GNSRASANQIESGGPGRWRPAPAGTCFMTNLRSVLTVCGLVLAASAPVHATSFTATLTSIKITARPGQVQTREFHLTLDKAQLKTRFKAHMEDWWRSEDGTESFYREPGTLTRSCG